ncbi:MAG: rhomboid family intramembrane serine protease [Planctomycetota bacterium]|nr:rhomboid family intramembrane serine protease [Planctomycetota bacterium]
MRDVLDKADEIPVTLVALIGYVTMALLTGLPDPDSEKLAAYGWMTALAVSEGEWWRLFTSSFLHGGLLHLAMNSFALMQLGPVVERSLGSARFFALYAIAQLASNLAVCLVYDPRMPVVGGSGAIFGILGGILGLQMRQGRNALSFLEFEGPRRMILILAAYLVLGAFIPFVSNTSHVGGLVGGTLATFVLLVPPRGPRQSLRAGRAAVPALFVGLTFYALAPVTRWDWLWERGRAATDPATSQAYAEAALKSYFGRNHVDARDRLRFTERELRPAGDGG